MSAFPKARETLNVDVDASSNGPDMTEDRGYFGTLRTDIQAAVLEFCGTFLFLLLGLGLYRYFPRRGQSEFIRLQVESKPPPPRINRLSPLLKEPEAVMER